MLPPPLDPLARGSVPLDPLAGGPGAARAFDLFAAGVLAAALELAPALGRETALALEVGGALALALPSDETGHPLALLSRSLELSFRGLAPLPLSIGLALGERLQLGLALLPFLALAPLLLLAALALGLLGPPLPPPRAAVVVVIRTGVERRRADLGREVVVANPASQVSGLDARVERGRMLLGLRLPGLGLGALFERLR